MTAEIYAREALSVHKGIPVFSINDDYVDNYRQISRDHLESIHRGENNPWIPDELWVALEDSTVELVRKYTPDGGRILDVGVGLGRLLSRVPSLRRFGMDISLEYLETAAANGIDVCMSRVEDMPYRAETFDTVVCTDVLEHVVDLYKCCRNVLAVLKPGGTLIVRVPNREDMRPYLATDLPYRFIHLRSFDEASLRLLFEKMLCCTVQEVVPAGLWPLRDRMRWLLPLPKWWGIVYRLSSMSKGFGKSVHTKWLSCLFHPCEINIVVRKPGARSCAE